MEKIKQAVSLQVIKHDNFKKSLSNLKQRNLFKFTDNDVKCIDVYCFKAVQKDLQELRHFDFWIRYLLSPDFIVPTLAWMTDAEHDNYYDIDHLDCLIAVLRDLVNDVVEVNETTINEYIKSKNISSDPFYMFSEVGLTKFFSWSTDSTDCNGCCEKSNKESG